MDRFEELQYNIAMEGVGTKVLLGTIAVLGALTAKYAISDKIDSNRKNRYDQEKAAGNVSAKTMAKANKVREAGMPYPEFAAKRDECKKYAPQVHEIIKKYQKALDDEIRKLCTSKDEFKPFTSVTKQVSFNSDDVLHVMSHPDYSDLAIFSGISVSSFESCFDDEVEENITDKDFDGLRHVAADSDIEAMRKTGLQIIRFILPKIDALCKTYCKKCADEVNRIDDLPVTAYDYRDYNGDDIYNVYGINFGNKK